MSDILHTETWQNISVNSPVRVGTALWTMPFGPFVGKVITVRTFAALHNCQSREDALGEPFGQKCSILSLHSLCQGSANLITNMLLSSVLRPGLGKMLEWKDYSKQVSFSSDTGGITQVL